MVVEFPKFLVAVCLLNKGISSRFFQQLVCERTYFYSHHEQNHSLTSRIPPISKLSALGSGARRISVS